jgi:hypothetical protein
MATSLLRAMHSFGGNSAGGYAAGATTSDAARIDSERTWTAAPPSPSYKLVEALKVPAKGVQQPLPADLRQELQTWREQLVAHQEEEERRKSTPESGPEKPPNPYTVVITEEGSGFKLPKLGDRVRLGYAVALPDGSVLDMCSDFERTLGHAVPVPGDTGLVTPDALDSALIQMKRGQVASVTCAISRVFPEDCHVVAEHGTEVEVVCEVKLFEIFSSKDCSFKRGSGVVLKEVVKEGIGAWCHNPTDEGYCELRIEESRADGCMLPSRQHRFPFTVKVTPGNGELCDALECAILEMKQHETAVVTCKDVSLCIGGAPNLVMGPECLTSDTKEVTIKVSMLDFHKGPDPWQIDESDRLTFALRRKEHADRLLKEGRLHLAGERYQKILELFQHLDRPRMTDKFLGKWELYQQCRQLRTACRLNLTLCRLRLEDADGALQASEAVLQCEPENLKALFRHAKALILRKDYAEACKDLERLLDIDGTVTEAKELLKRATSLRLAADKKQRSEMKFKRMIGGIDDLRSIKNNYLDAPDDSEDEA